MAEVILEWCNCVLTGQERAINVGSGTPQRPGTEPTAAGDANPSVSTFHDTRAARAIRRVELGDFLRTRRGAITPTDVGLTVTGHRKTPGLRREEVAQLAGVGLSWYTWLEQARDITPSVQVLEAIGRALRLDQTQTDHVFHLAGLDIPSSALAGSADELDFDHIVRSLLPHAAYVLNPRFDVVAFNANAELILGGLAQREPGERNLLRWLFDDSGPYQGLDESIAPVAYANLRDFRVEYARNAGDPWYEQLVAELSAQSAQFRTWWDEHAVRVIVPTLHRIPHRQYGSLQILFIETRPVHRPEHRLRIIVAADETTRAIFAEHHSTRG